MADLKYTKSKGTSLLSVAAIVLYAMTAMAQNAMLAAMEGDDGQ